MLFEPWTILLSIIAAFMVGIGKTGVPGLGLISIPLMAFAFPAKESVGVLLLLLIVGDVFTVSYYRQYANIKILLKLVPWVAVGIAVGSIFLSMLDNHTIRPILGLIVLIMLIIQIVRDKKGDPLIPDSRYLPAVIGILAGCVTTIGNAAGPIMGIYLLMMHFRKDQFMGTFGWFFLTVNCSKVPVFLYLGVLQGYAFYYALPLVPMIVLGAYFGKRLLGILSQKFFDGAVIAFAGLAAIILMIN